MTVVTVSNTDQALLIILSIFLALFLLLSIIALIWILQILRELKRIIKRGEELARQAEGNVTAFFERTSSAFALVNIISNIADTVFKSKKSGKKDK